MRSVRGYALFEALGVVAIVALAVTAAVYANQIVTFHADVHGIASAFERLAQADKVWRDGGGTAEYAFPDLHDAKLLSSMKIHDATTAGYAGLPFTFQLESRPLRFSVVVASEAKARQITAQLGSNASYVSESAMFRVAYHPQYVPSLARLVASHSMHTKESNSNRLHQLAFTEAAHVTIGASCGFRDGKWHGGIAFDQATLKLAVCQRLYTAEDQPERVWQVAGAYVTMPPPNESTPRQIAYCTNLDKPYSPDCCACPNLEQRRIVREIGFTEIVVVECDAQPTCDDHSLVCDASAECKICESGTSVHRDASCPTTEYCGNGSSVGNRGRDCKDCWDLTNIPITQDCPAKLDIEFCDDGTAVPDRSHCKSCSNGSVGPKKSCERQPMCGDGSFVNNATNDCKDCPSGVNIPVGESCPATVECPCGGSAPSLDQCPPVVMTSCPNGCPNVCTDELCEEPAATGPDACSPGFSMVETTRACSVQTQCVKVKDPCPCGGVRDSNNQCPLVVKTRNEVNCPLDYTKVSTATACSIDETCVRDCPCSDETVTSPATCPSVAMKSCSDGCDDVCPKEACPEPVLTGPTSCTSGFTLVDTPGTCTIQSSCIKDGEPCPCGGVRHPDGSCSAVVKTRIPKVCPDGYANVDVQQKCTIEERCVKDCPCDGGQVIAPAECPAVVKTRTTVKCPEGYTKKVSETACAIEESCAKTCPCSGVDVTYPDTCPIAAKRELGSTSCPSDYKKMLVAETQCTTTHACEKVCPCGAGSATLPDTCPTITKTELGRSSCPRGYAKVKQAETSCSITHTCEKTCPCDGGIVTFPNQCPAVNKTEQGVATCPTGYTRIKTAESQCTVTHACRFTCPNGQVVNDKSACPTKSCACNQPNVLGSHR